MKILIIGNGAREHALTWAISQNPRCTKIYCSPGNAGTTELATNVDIDVTSNNEILEMCLLYSIDLVIVGPEKQFEQGLTNALKEKNILVFGPTMEASQLEASKSFKFDKGIQFENYAHARVRGSMIDEIRKMSSQPRSSLTLKKNISEATIQLQGKLGRKPNEHELAEHIGISVSELQKDIALSRKFETTSIETLENEILNIINNNEKLKTYLDKKELIKKIFVPNKIINLIIK